MIAKFRRRKGDVSLTVGDRIVAQMINHWDSKFWRLTDVRLAPHVTPHEFSFVGAEEYWSEYSPQSVEESDFVKSKLHNYVENNGKIWYCMFDGVVCGKHYESDFDKGFDQGGLFTYSEGMTKLQEIKREWLDYDNIKTKLPNPKLQPSVSQLRFAFKHPEF